MTNIILGSNSLFAQLEKDPVTFIHDPIAVALIRTEGNGNIMMKDIDQDPRTEEFAVLGGYLQRAEEIRAYYKKRLFYGALSNRFSSTAFRKDLQACLERDDKYTLQSSEIGMIARLPDFYQEDITRDMLQKECNGKKPTPNSFWEDAMPAKYLTKTQSRYGKNRQYCYWFKVKKDKACCFWVEGTNPLLNLFNDYLEPGKVIQLQGGFTARVQDGFHFYQGKCKVLV